MRFSMKRTIRAGLAETFDAFADYASYERLLPRYYPSVRVRSVRQDTAVVEQHMNIGERRLVMMAKHVADRPHTHEVFVIGGDAKGTHIRESFAPKGDSTDVQIDVDLCLGLGMRIAGVEGRFRDDYGMMLDDLAGALRN